jgi:hypothetical protein
VYTQQFKTLIQNPKGFNFSKLGLYISKINLHFSKHKKIGFILALAFISGCKSAAPEPTAFLGTQATLLSHNELIPFDRVWEKPGLNENTYNKIMLKPISQDFRINDSTIADINVRNIISSEKEDITDFSKYFENSLIKKLNESNMYSQKANPHTAVLEISITRVVPGKPVYGAIANTAIFIPVVAVIAIPIKIGMKATQNGPLKASIAIEGKFTDSVTGETLGIFSDYRTGKRAIINFNDFTAYGNIRQIADNWSKDIVEVLKLHSLQSGKKVKPGNRFCVINY